MKKTAMFTFVVLVLLTVFSCDEDESEKQDIDFIVPGDTLAAKFAWLNLNAKNNSSYILEVTADETLAFQSIAYGDDGTGWDTYALSKYNVTILIKGIGSPRSVSPSDASLFAVFNGNTLILDENLILQGKNNGYREAIIRVWNGGKLIMNQGAKITGQNNGFIGGGGVCVTGGTFTMNGGEISGNTFSGNINSGSTGGGGVYCDGTFTMNGGEISGNTASGSTAIGGGGVCVTGGIFTMNGGEISGNTASGFGGGVYCLGTFTTFTKNGGTITGYASDTVNGNVVKYSSSVLSNKGHAVYVYIGGDAKRRETTAGSDVNLDSNISWTAGGWE